MEWCTEGPDNLKYLSYCINWTTKQFSPQVSVVGNSERSKQMAESGMVKDDLGESDHGKRRG